MEKRYALITGATSGIGAEFAKILSKSYNLILVGRNQEKLALKKQELLSDLAMKNKIAIELVCCDLSDIESAEFVFKEVTKMSLDVTVLINNAGSGVFGEHVNLDNTRIMQMLNLNIYTLTLLCKYFGNQMKQKSSGYILNVASLAAYQPVPHFASYAASKSYVLNFSEALSKELEDYGVTVTCLSPGQTRTNFFASAGIGNNKKGFYRLNTRISASKVAEIGLNALFKKRLSVISGIKNNLIVNLNRLLTRSLTAKISKFITNNP